MEFDLVEFEQDYQKQFMHALHDIRDKPAIFSQSGTYTGAALLEKSARLRDELLRQGIRPEDRCAIAGSDDIGVLVAILATLRVGGIIVGLPNFYATDTWVHFMKDSRPSVVICEGYLKGTFDDIIERESFDTNLIEITAEGDLNAPSGTEAGEDHVCMPEDPLLLRYTSGSTGTPKGIVLNHRNMLANLRIYTAFGKREKGRYLSLTPPTEMLGHFLSLAALINQEELVIYSGNASLEGIIRCIEQERITDVFLPTTQMIGFAENEVIPMTDLSSLDRIVYAGQSAPAAALKRSQELLDCELVQLYGQTECGLTTYLSPEDHTSGDLSILGSAGRPMPFPDIRVEIRDPATNEVLPAGKTGHILIRSDSVCKKTWGFDEPQNMDGPWRDTLDLGFFDEAGYLTIRGRDRDVILYRGFVVYAYDIEDCLSKISGVKEIVVHSVADEKDGEHVFTWVVKEPGAMVDRDELAKHIEIKLGTWYRPSYIEFVDHIPTKPGMDKYDKPHLREEAEKRIGNGLEPLVR